MSSASANRWPSLGDAREDIETPTLLFYEEIFEQNLRSFSAMADDHGVSLRPHVKPHRIPELARRQVAVSGPGIMCQKLSLAEVMVRHGLRDIVVVCPVVTPPKLKRLMWVAERADTLSVVVDDPRNVEQLAKEAMRNAVRLGVTVELDLGGNRTGVKPGSAAVDLAERVAAADSLEFTGFLAYENHVLYQTSTRAAFEEAADEVLGQIEATVDAVEDHGVPVPEVRTGTTGTSKYVCQHPVVTELNPGRFFLNDTSLIQFVDEVDPEKCAARILTTVISKPSSQRVVVDAGAKSISWTANHMPRCTDDSDASYTEFSSEHGIVEVGDASIDPEVGDKLEFIVGNIDGAINLQDHVVGIADGHVQSVWNVPTAGQCR